MDAIALEGNSRSFSVAGQRLVALRHLSLHVPEGAFVAVVGPNGSGKSTLLRIIAGLLEPDEGSIQVHGRPVTGPDERVGLVFQEPRLLPWRTLLDNVALPLQLRGQAKASRRQD